MANSTEIRFRKTLPWKVVKAAIVEILDAKFKSGYKIDADPGEGVFVGFDQRDWYSPHILLWPHRKDGKIKVLEFSDNCFIQYDNGWFSCWLSSALAEKLKGKHYSECTGENYKSDFHTTYPTFYSWRVRRDGFVPLFFLRTLYKNGLQEMKKGLPKNVYEVFAEK